MAKIIFKLDIPELFSFNDENWISKIVLTFYENLVAYSPPISVTSVLLMQNDLIQCGYITTPPLRKFDEEVLFSEGDTTTLEIDIRNELTKYDPDEINELIHGQAVLSIDGIVWLKSGIEEFKKVQVVKIKRI